MIVLVAASFVVIGDQRSALHHQTIKPPAHSSIAHTTEPLSIFFTEI
jgi:hypothetical protein